VRLTGFDGRWRFANVPAPYPMRGREFICAACPQTCAQFTVLLPRNNVRRLRDARWMFSAASVYRTLDVPRELTYSSYR